MHLLFALMNIGSVPGAGDVDFERLEAIVSAFVAAGERATPGANPAE